jgi:hypothetical protein
MNNFNFFRRGNNNLAQQAIANRRNGNRLPQSPLKQQATPPTISFPFWFDLSFQQNKQAAQTLTHKDGKDYKTVMAGEDYNTGYYWQYDTIKISSGHLYARHQSDNN